MSHIDDYPSLLLSSPTSDNKSQTSTEGDDLDYSHDCHSSHKGTFQQSCSKAKTSLCKNYIEQGFCPYGKRCQFAHGPEELKINKECNRSYKTKECHAFNKKGYCCFGERCNFIHRQETHNDDYEKWQNIYENHRETIQNAQNPCSSRLLRLLEQ